MTLYFIALKAFILLTTFSHEIYLYLVASWWYFNVLIDVKFILITIYMFMFFCVPLLLILMHFFCFFFLFFSRDKTCVINIFSSSMTPKYSIYTPRMENWLSQFLQAFKRYIQKERESMTMICMHINQIAKTTSNQPDHRNPSLRHTALSNHSFLII